MSKHSKNLFVAVELESSHRGVSILLIGSHSIKHVNGGNQNESLHFTSEITSALNRLLAVGVPRLVNRYCTFSKLYCTGGRNQAVVYIYLYGFIIPFYKSKSQYLRHQWGIEEKQNLQDHTDS